MIKGRQTHKTEHTRSIRRKQKVTFEGKALAALGTRKHLEEIQLDQSFLKIQFYSCNFFLYYQTFPLFLHSDFPETQSIKQLFFEEKEEYEGKKPTN